MSIAQRTDALLPCTYSHSLISTFLRGYSGSSTGPELSHVCPDSNRPKMVDVSDKAVSSRTAHARAVVLLPPEVWALFAGTQQSDGATEFTSKKGPVVATAIVAGTMAVKRTSELIPFCHPLPIDSCSITVTVVAGEPPHHPRALQVDCVVKVQHKTGVEMEALTGASIAALTIYDMCKALSHNMIIRDTRLLLKTGGKSGLRTGG